MMLIIHQPTRRHIPEDHDLMLCLLSVLDINGLHWGRSVLTLLCAPPAERRHLFCFLQDYTLSKIYTRLHYGTIYGNTQ